MIAAAFSIFAPLAVAWPFSLEFFSAWQALAIFAGLSVPIVLLGMRSLTGLGPVRKWVAIGFRLSVLLVFILILGGIRWQRQHHDLEVMVLRDISQSTQQVHDYPGEATGDSLQASINKYLQDASTD